MSNVYIEYSTIEEYIDFLNRAKSILLENANLLIKKFENYTWRDNIYNTTKESLNQYLDKLNNFISVLDDSINQLKIYSELLDNYFNCI